MAESPYELRGYADDEIEILSAIKDPTAALTPGFVVDVYGVKTRIDDTLNFWPEAADISNKHLLGLPIPGNFHWSALEWIGLVRAALEARNKFRIMELGAAWGPACVSGSVIARLNGVKDIKLAAVEGDPHHFRRLVRHVRDNGFNPDEQYLYHAAVAVNEGVAYWPVSEPTSAEFGFRPMEDEKTDYLNRSYEATARVNLLAMRDLIRLEPYWDLIHIDVQGAEFDICKDAMTDLVSRTKRVIIGTHSRVIEGNLILLFHENGWLLENEKPCKFNPAPSWKTLESLGTVDGVQIWLNPEVGRTIKGAQAPAAKSHWMDLARVFSSKH